MPDHPSWLDPDRAATQELWSSAPRCICVWGTEARQIDGVTHWPLKQRNRKCREHGEQGQR